MYSFPAIDRCIFGILLQENTAKLQFATFLCCRQTAFNIVNISSATMLRNICNQLLLLLCRVQQLCMFRLHIQCVKSNKKH